MKKVFAMIFAACIMFCGCGGGNDTGGKPEKENKNLATVRDIMNVSSYDLNTYLLPFWRTREVYQETVLFLEGETEAPLLYPADDVFCVKNYALNVVYAEGKDYTVKDGKLVRTENSAIPYIPLDDYYIKQPDAKNIGVNKEKVPFELDGDRWLNFGENDEITSKQISVCYRHSEEWKGPVPQYGGDKLKNFLSKIKNGEDVSIAFYGDSITTGAQSSGFEHLPPRADIYPVMICKYIENRYGVKVNYKNGAVGGYTTNQGAQNIGARILTDKADLLVLAFGMNDLRTLTGTYKSLVRDMARAFKDANSDGEVILVGTMTPNYETDWYGNQVKFITALREISEECDYCAVADVTDVFEYLFTAGKRFRDITVNNVNHPNDFGARLYAQVILQTALGGDFWA